jgi:hypothetical protein
VSRLFRKWSTGSAAFAAAVVVLLAASVASAAISTWQTPAGSDVGGLPVAARATFTTQTDHVTVVLQNLQANPTSVSQSLSDLSFSLSDPNADVGVLDASFGVERTIHADGSFTDGGTVDTGWGLENAFLRLHVLGTPTAPAHTLIGPPDGGGIYSNANASIAGNGPHNPFLHDVAVFFLHVPFVTADTTVEAVVFSFGTTEGVVIPGFPVPEPSTGAIFLLSGAVGAIVMATLRRRGMAGGRA